jgi:hypothetical protein
MVSGSWVFYTPYGGLEIFNIATGTVWRYDGTAWANSLADTTAAKAALLSTIGATPAGVREFMEQYGFTSTYMTDSTDLNSVTGATDRTVCFEFNASTLNIPFSGAYGRGIQIAGGGNYSTQVVWINGTYDTYIRYRQGSSFTAWKKSAFNDNDLINTAWVTVTGQNGWSPVPGRRAAYRKVLGKVDLEIDMSGSAIATGTVLFNLPVGYRPSALLLFPCYTSGKASRVGTLYLNAGGDLCIEAAFEAAGEIGFTVSFTPA